MDAASIKATKGGQTIHVTLTDSGIFVGPGKHKHRVGYPVNLSAREVNPDASMHDATVPGINATDTPVAERMLGKHWRGTGAEAMLKVIDALEADGAEVA